MRVGINGFGRIGRIAARVALGGVEGTFPALDIVHVNDPGCANEMGYSCRRVELVAKVARSHGRRP